MKDRLLDKVIRFDTLLGLVALIIALVAAFFSVYGIATLFAGAFISTVIMGTVLEIGKLVSVTYLYRYWKKTKFLLKTYLVVALVILMLITSGGIFGYLSAAYQKSATLYKAQQEQIVLVENTKAFAQDKVEQAKNRILVLNEMRLTQEARLSSAQTNSLISRNFIALKQLQDQTTEMIKSTEADIKVEQGKIDAGIVEIGEIAKKVNEMTYADNSKDIRTFEFVASLFNTTLDNVARWFIFLLIVVFDPLAIALILAYNVVVFKKTRGIPTEETDGPPTPIVVEHQEDKKKLFDRLKSFSFNQQKIPRPLEPNLPTPIQFNFSKQNIPKTSEPVKSVEPVDESPSSNIISDPFYRGYFKSY